MRLRQMDISAFSGQNKVTKMCPKYLLNRYYYDCPNVFPGLKWPPLFANYSLMVILIEKLIREMNLDTCIYRVIEFIFST